VRHCPYCPVLDICTQAKAMQVSGRLIL